MTMRDKLLKIEGALQRTIDAAQSAREGESDSNAVGLCVDIEHECHELIKRISDLTEGELKTVVPVDFKSGRKGTA